MLDSTFFFILLGIYLSVMLGIAVFFFRSDPISKTLQGFYLGWRGGKGSMSPKLLLFSYAATLYSAGTIVGIPGFIYSNGIGAFGFFVGAGLLQALCLATIGFALRRYSQQFKAYSPIEVLRNVYQSKWLAFIVFFATVLFMLPHLAAQLVGVGRLLEGLTGNAIQYETGVLAILVIMFIYCEVGGFRAIVWTDVIQFILVIGTLLVLTGLLLFGDWGTGSAGVAQLNSPDVRPLLSTPGPNDAYTVPILVSFFVFIGLWPLGHPSVSVRIMASKDDKGILAIIMGMCFIPLIMFIPAALIGLIGKGFFPDLASGDAVLGSVLRMIGEYGGIYFGLVCIFALGAVAAAMSTTDSQLLALAKITLRDLVRGVFNVDMSEKRELTSARFLIFGFLVLAFLIGLNPPELLLNLSLLSGAATAILGPVYVGMAVGRPSKNGAIACIVLGYAFLILSKTVIPNGWLLGFDNGLAPIILSFLIYFAIWFVERDKNADKPIAAQPSL